MTLLTALLALVALLTLQAAHGQSLICTSTDTGCVDTAQTGPLPEPLAKNVREETSLDFCRAVSLCSAAPASRILIPRHRPLGSHLYKGHRCSRLLDCNRPEVEDKCGADFGSNIDVDISWLSVLSSKTTGAAMGVWSSGIPAVPGSTTEQPIRFLFNAESPSSLGFTRFVQFRGTPDQMPLTTIMTLQPALNVLPATEPAEFRLSQFKVIRADLTDISFQTILVQKGWFIDGTCNFKDHAPFRSIAPELIRNFRSSTITSLNGRTTFIINVELDITEITLTVKPHECLNVITSTGKPCCSVNPDKKILLGKKCVEGVW